MAKEGRAGGLDLEIVWIADVPGGGGGLAAEVGKGPACRPRTGRGRIAGGPGGGGVGRGGSGGLAPPEAGRGANCRAPKGGLGAAVRRAEAGRRRWCQEEAGEAAPGGRATAGSGRVAHGVTCAGGGGSEGWCRRVGVRKE
nr:glycine-rich protein DOT1-like [Aegilops tauschii subsp. strangulata]